ncbi:MAG: coniferyl-aldehyde dehydrogenase [Halobacteriovoraceae bacterium]|nr:coniferyl-aldehyde dehydrogenase [Halobacteriovoraceae bacterium]|tara:strand:- start:3733 stop:5151 length:1419 start_codon:yes stop_codon:yes gene_type:complete
MSALNESSQIFSSKSEIASTFENLKLSYQKNPYPSYKFRQDILNRIKKILIDNEQKLYQALSKDYGHRSEFDSLIADFLPSVLGIKYTKSQLRKWMKPVKRHAGLALFPSQIKVHYQPLGVVGVIVPWNFPLYLSLSPMVTAIAAGNRVMVKMSEFTPATYLCMKEIFSPLSDHIQFFNGEAEISSFFSTLAFDHLLFTGSTQVGKHVAAAAAQNLTPITLELGGKSPAIVHKDAYLKRAVEAILMGKTLNSGQICVAPDYVLVHKDVKDEFVQMFMAAYNESYSNSDQFPYTHLISDKHIQRMNDYLRDAENKGASIIHLEDSKNQRPYAPVLLLNVSNEMKVMQEEVFGSLLPILEYDDIDAALEFVNKRPRPLALYLMTENSQIKQRFLYESHSGGVCINDTLTHVAAEDAPFGGIGDSGMGHYHGVEGFRTFSKAKTVLTTPSWLPRNYLLLKNKAIAFKLFRFLFIR